MVWPLCGDGHRANPACLSVYSRLRSCAGFSAVERNGVQGLSAESTNQSQLLSWREFSQGWKSRGLGISPAGCCMVSNCRKVQVGGALGGLWPNVLLAAGSAVGSDQAAQGCLQLAPGSLRGSNLCSLYRQPPALPTWWKSVSSSLNFLFQFTCLVSYPPAMHQSLALCP